MVINQASHFTPGRIILYTLFGLITLGALLLALPFAHTGTLSWLDLFLTSTSATCVTGLFSVSLNQFTLFGKCVILGLVQIGGIGIVTLSLFVMSLFLDLGLSTQLMAGKLLEIDSWQHTKKIIAFIIMMTLCFEAVGALLIFLIIRSHYPFAKALFLSIFHAVSSFCNAGISLFEHDLQQFGGNYSLLAITAFLIAAGGLGFITWREIIAHFYAWKEERRHVFSLHSKIILLGSPILILFTAVIILILEHANTMAHMSTSQAMINSLFYAISCRSTGFLTVPAQDLQLATLFFIMIVAFIGSAPGSTGSGIKITTLAIFLATVKAAISGRTSVEIRGRTISKDQVYKSIAIISLSLFWIALTTLCLLITERYGDFLDLFLEACSSLTNLGLSTGLTPYLSSVGKIFVMACMIIGRIGSLTLVLALKLRHRGESAGFSYPEERVMLS